MLTNSFLIESISFDLGSIVASDLKVIYDRWEGFTHADMMALVSLHMLLMFASSKIYWGRLPFIDNLIIVSADSSEIETLISLLSHTAGHIHSTTAHAITPVLLNGRYPAAYSQLLFDPGSMNKNLHVVQESLTLVCIHLISIIDERLYRSHGPHRRYRLCTYCPRCV